MLRCNHNRSHHLGHCSQRAMTLIELTLALGLSSLVAIATIKMWNYFEQSTRANEAENEAKSDLESLVQLIEDIWKVRQHPSDPATNRPKPFTATQKGFTLRTASGANCLSNCPRITIKVENRSPSGTVVDLIDVKTICIDPGQIEAKNRLNSFNFSDPTLATSCVTCSPGTIPIVNYTSQNSPNYNRHYPSNTRNLPSSFRITRILGMTACWDQTADGPAFLNIGFYMLKNQTSTSGIKFKIIKKLLPFDNFSKMILKPKNSP